MTGLWNLQGSADGSAVSREDDLYVAARRVRVRAYLMGSGDDLRSPRPVFDPWEGDVQLDCDVEAPLLGRDQAHLRIDGHLTELDALAPRHDTQGPLEASCISDREQLLGVSAASVTSHLF